jgi:hypothetical protein
VILMFSKSPWGFAFVGLGGVFCAPLVAQDSPTIDGIGRPSSTEVNSVFRCEGFRIVLRYREELYDPLRVGGLEQAMRVTLLRLEVSGRRVPAAERGKAEELFRSLGWIDRADARCAADRVQISVVAMSKAEWIAFIEERTRERPRTHSRTIEISRRGLVTIDGPGL